MDGWMDVYREGKLQTVPKSAAQTAASPDTVVVAALTEAQKWY
jgi:hypothetical protein